MATGLGILSALCLHPIAAGLQMPSLAGVVEMPSLGHNAKVPLVIRRGIQCSLCASA
jgi:hypothetical protein